MTGTQVAVGGVRQPIVGNLPVLAPLFTMVSGKPLDGFLMLTVAVLLAWNAAKTTIWASGCPGCQPRSVPGADGQQPLAGRRPSAIADRHCPGSGRFVYASVAGAFSRLFPGGQRLP
jgi:hypothetical protein